MHVSRDLTKSIGSEIRANQELIGQSVGLQISRHQNVATSASCNRRPIGYDCTIDDGVSRRTTRNVGTRGRDGAGRCCPSHRCRITLRAEQLVVHLVLTLAPSVCLAHRFDAFYLFDLLLCHLFDYRGMTKKRSGWSLIPHTNSINVILLKSDCTRTFSMRRSLSSRELNAKESTSCLTVRDSLVEPAIHNSNLFQCEPPSHTTQKGKPNQVSNNGFQLHGRLLWDIPTHEQ